MGIKKILHKDSYLILVILLLALLVRVYNINFENFSSDEGLTVYHSQKSIMHNIKWSLSDDYLPLYHVLLSSWVSIFGMSETRVRLLSVFFGIFSVYMVYVVGSTIFNKKVGIFSSIILAFSPFNVYYSQEARPYSFYLFLALCSIYFYLIYIKNKQFLFLYVFSTILLLYTHGVAPLLVFFQNVHYFFIVRKNIKKWILTQLLIFVAFAPLLLFIAKETTKFSSITYPWMSTPNLAGILKFFYVYIGGESFTFRNLIFGSALSMIFIMLIIFTIFKVFKGIRKINKNELNDVLFVLLWLVVPLIILMLFSFLLTTLFVEKYIIFSSAALYIAVSYSIAKLHKFLQLLSIFSIVIISLGIIYHNSHTIDSPEWSSAIYYVKSRISSDEDIIINTPDSKHAFAYYFDKSIFKADDISRQLAFNNIYGVGNSMELPKEIVSKDGVWLILHNSEYFDRNGTLFKYFDNKYKLIEYQKFKGVGVYHFSKTSWMQVLPPEDYTSPQYTDKRLSLLKPLIKKFLKIGG